MQIIAITTTIPPTAAPIIALVGETGLASDGYGVGVIAGVEGVENGTKVGNKFLSSRQAIMFGLPELDERLESCV
jgi:hypothetical protein